MPQTGNRTLWIYSEDRLVGRPFLFQILPLALPFSGWRIARSMICIAWLFSYERTSIGEHHCTCLSVSRDWPKTSFIFFVKSILPLKENSPSMAMTLPGRTPYPSASMTRRFGLKDNHALTAVDASPVGCAVFSLAFFSTANSAKDNSYGTDGQLHQTRHRS